MPGIIYARVSTIMQNKNKSVSLDAQEQLCKKYANEQNITIKRVYKEVCSTFRKIPNMLRAASQVRNATILCADVSRFSRSAKLGLSIANKVVANGGKLIFIAEQLIYDNTDKEQYLIMHLKQTELESQKIGMRVKRSNSFIRSRGGLTNGIVPYGFNYNVKITKNIHESNIVKFIKVARTDHFKESDINHALGKIIKTSKPIEIIDKDGYALDVSNRKLTYYEIADLLNSYNINKRKKKWTHNTVKSAVKSHDRQVSSNELSMCEIARSLPILKRTADDDLFAEFCKFRKFMKSKS